ncbi:NAD(P)-dependent dehydrogenase (short-subunit alcohol dehydrogenase family) [Pedobacter sp. UYP30]|uniref:SDR family NAD(P)-dependent oxidoreductase n=1 Tax=Pedobacter sp. UYP30 TaxID=1756400 RepID=UPI003395D347
MRTVLITGANKGIGFEVAKQMAQKGYFVYLGCRDKNKGIDAVEKLKEQGFMNTEFLQIEVSNLESVKNARKELESKVEILDVLINNAGIPGEQPQKPATGNIAMIREIFETNYFGVIQTTQQFLSLMKKSELPVIVNVSSELSSFSMQTSADRKANWNEYHFYGATKTALNTFTLGLANELDSAGFKINSVTPGYTATDLNGFAGFKTAAQGAEPIVKLATIDKNGPTGKFFSADGELPW